MSALEGTAGRPEKVRCSAADSAASERARRSSSRSRSSGRALTPEQNALVSGFVALLTAFVAGACWGPASGASFAGAAPSAETFAADTGSVLAALGGSFHFASYLSTLCAFSSASSTVITPLMQLSAVWMLPFSMLTATLGFATFIRPVHLLSVALICAGGFLPAADGALSELTHFRFWRQKAIRYVMLGEFLICCYNLILHQATFAGDRAAAAGLGAGTGGDAVATSLRFFLISRAANGLTCMCLFLGVPSLRCHAFAMREVSARFFLVALLGECLSMLGVWLVTFSYASFYEPSVVNAVEGGLQQLFNLLFAVLSHRVLGLGRDVDQVTVKCVSFVVVAAGLTLSTA